MSLASPATASLNKKRKDFDDKATVSDGDEKRLSYDKLEMKIFMKDVELLDQRKKIAELEQVIENLKAKHEGCGDGGDDDDDDISEDGRDDLNASDPWVAKYLQLREFRMLQGHCNAPSSERILSIWMKNQRQLYANVKKGSGAKISPERIRMLDSLSFNWGTKFPAPLTWDARFSELEKFKNTMGHLNIQVSPTSPSSLAKWVTAQRTEYKRFRKGRDSLLNLEQIGRLNGIGFKWKTPRSV